MYFALVSSIYFFPFFCGFGSVPMVLQMIPSITSSAPPPIEVNLESLHTDDSRSVTRAVNDLSAKLYNHGKDAYKGCILVESS